MSDEMTREELISITIDKYTDFYQIKVVTAKLSSLGISVEDIAL